MKTNIIELGRDANADAQVALWAPRQKLPRSVQRRLLAVNVRKQLHRQYEEACRKDGVVFSDTETAKIASGIRALAAKGKYPVGPARDLIRTWAGLSDRSFIREMQKLSALMPYETTFTWDAFPDPVGYWRGRSMKSILAELSKIIGVTREKRARLKTQNIEAIDETKAQRRKRRLMENAARKADKREALGATPRAQSLSATRPWEALGMSRSTYERKGLNGKCQVDANSGAMTQIRARPIPSIPLALQKRLKNRGLDQRGNISQEG
jgi:hypothetical protein